MNLQSIAPEITEMGCGVEPGDGWTGGLREDAVEKGECCVVVNGEFGNEWARG